MTLHKTTRHKYLTSGLWCFTTGLLLFAGAVHAKGTYQTPDDFLSEAFTREIPEPELLWLTGDTGNRVREILGHRPNSLRVRYWRKDERTVWILEEIGKEKPITTGFIVSNNQIEKVRVLIFRESRGWEVRYPFFTDQFIGRKINGDQKLDKPIDNITGATLSVNAITRLSRLALFLHKKVTT